MTDDVKQDEVLVGTEEKEVVELNEIEQQASKKGWKPQDEYEGDPAKWVSADEFLRREPLFDKINSLKTEAYQTRQEVSELRKTLTQLSEHHKRVRETEFNRALKQLQTARRDAMEDRDHDAVIELEERIDEVKDEKREFEQQLKQEQRTQTAAPTPEFVEWVKENGWYMQEAEMHDDADGIALSFIQRKQKSGQTINPAEVYEHVSQRIKKLYPEKFGDGTVSNTPKHSPVDSGRSNAPRSAPKERFTLTPTEEAICNNLVKQGLMTKDEYIAELKSYKSTDQR